MGHIYKTKYGTYRVGWRDPKGDQRTKTFRTKKDASAFMAEIESALNRGSYIDPRAGKTKFGPYAQRWLSGRNDELATAARDESVMRTHVLPEWGEMSLNAIGHTAVQRW